MSHSCVNKKCPNAPGFELYFNTIYSVMRRKLLCVCSGFYQLYQWYTNIVQGSTNGTVDKTIGTNGNANGTTGTPIGTIGKSIVPLALPLLPWATNGTIGNITNGTIGKPRTEPVFEYYTDAQFFQFLNETDIDAVLSRGKVMWINTRSQECGLQQCFGTDDHSGMVSFLQNNIYDKLCIYVFLKLNQFTLYKQRRYL